MNVLEQCKTPEFHSLYELADAIGVAYPTVWKWVKEEKIAAMRFGKLYRITDAEFKRILKEGF